MKPVMGLSIRGTGLGIPRKPFTNADFEKILDTSDEWIVTRTGVRQRYFTAEDESSLTMGYAAATNALQDAGMEATELDLIIFGTITPEYPLPATACLLQDQLGAGCIPAFDISAACCGYMYGFFIAAQMIAAGAYRNILVIGSEHMSSFIDFEDRASCILFGDAASAVILSKSDNPEQGLIYGSMGADGGGAKLIWVSGGGSRHPVSQTVVDERLHLLRMKGREVYKFAVKRMHAVIDEVLAETKISPEELSLVIPHQSNLRIIESARERLGLPPEKVMVNIDRYGNTSSASVGICLDEARRDGRLGPGDLLLMVAFGAGLTWASSLVRL